MVKQVDDDPLDHLFDEPKVVTKKLPKEIQGILSDAIKHSKRAGKNLPDISEFFD